MTIPGAAKDMDIHIHSRWECQTVHPLWKSLKASFKQVTHQLHLPKRNENTVHTEMCPWMFSSLANIQTSQKKKTPENNPNVHQQENEHIVVVHIKNIFSNK